MLTDFKTVQECGLGREWNPCVFLVVTTWGQPTQENSRTIILPDPTHSPPLLPPSPRAKPCACLAWQPLSHSPYFALENLEFGVWKQWWKRKISLAPRWTAVVGSGKRECLHRGWMFSQLSGDFGWLYLYFWKTKTFFFKALFLMKINHLNSSVGWSSSHLWEEESVVAMAFLENLEMVNIPVFAYLRSFC